MNNETGLDWMARNVQVWPCGMRAVLACYPRNVNALFWSCVSSNAGWITKEQWLSRRAELQNKPSWDDFGESAKFMAQDSDGAWMAFESEPAANYHVWSSTRGWCGYAREGRDRCRGEVLGDWRDTLEKRPDMHKNPEKIDTSVEHVQKKVKSMHEWFESGDLPPVGIAVQLWHGGTYAYDCELIAKRGNDFVLWNLTWDRPDSADCMMCIFKPIPTEREVLIEIIKKTDDTDDKIADAILAAGFSRRDK